MTASSDIYNFDGALEFIINENNQNIDLINAACDQAEEYSEIINNLKRLLGQSADDLHDQEKKSSFTLQKSEQKNIELANYVVSMDSELKTLRAKDKQAVKSAKISAKDLKAMAANKASQLESNKLLRKRVDRLTSELKEERGNLPQLETVYKNNTNEYLIVHPTKQSLGICHSKAGNVVLLYTDKTGVYLSAALDSHNQAVFSSPLQIGNNLSERTKKTIRNNSIRPSQQVIDFATQWLYRVNVVQKSTVKPQDIICKNEDAL